MSRLTDETYREVETEQGQKVSRLQEFVKEHPQPNTELLESIEDTEEIRDTLLQLLAATLPSFVEDKDTAKGLQTSLELYEEEIQELARNYRQFIDDVGRAYRHNKAE
jgi:hypothetical protein